MLMWYMSKISDSYGGKKISWKNLNNYLFIIINIKYSLIKWYFDHRIIRGSSNKVIWFHVEHNNE